ncbi:MAG: anthrax toxin-like adenylyl cyclase domain-containing protein [Pseudomonadota bacterium]
MAFRKESKKSIFRGEEVTENVILRATGIPAVFADVLKNISLEKGMAIGLRAGTPMQRYMMPCEPKPVTYKAKTGNWGFTKGVIAEDKALGKVVNNDGEMVIKERDDKKELPKHPETVIHKVSLREVVAGIESGEFEFITARNGRITVKATDGPTNSNYEFSINLLEPKDRITPQIDIKNIKEITANLVEVAEPTWWKPQYGDFKKLSSDFYPAQSRDADQPNNEFTDIKVFAVYNEKKGGLLPVTGDQDALWFTRPAGVSDDNGVYSKVYNTFQTEGTAQLLSVRNEMAMIEAGDDVEKLLELTNISDSSIARLGCVTAFESEVIDSVNKDFNAEVEHMMDLFQHGAENRNPGNPSPLDSPMVHFWRGEVFLTQDEDDLVDFVMQPDYLEENILDVHPRWDMAVWAGVVEKQFLLHQPVPPMTMAAFVEFRQENNIPLGDTRKEEYMAFIEKSLADAYADKNFNAKSLATRFTETALKTYVEFKEDFKQTVPKAIEQLYNERKLGEVAQPKANSSTAMMAAMLSGNKEDAKTILAGQPVKRMDVSIEPKRDRTVKQVAAAPEPEPEQPASTRRYKS